MIVQEILSHQLKTQQELDRILTRCCELVLMGQETDPEHYGMVAACVVLPTGEEVYGVNHRDSEGLHIHAERAALNACETVDKRSMIVTTLSPCNRPMDDRMGESCTDLIEFYGIGLANVYCGYKDPSQAEDGVEETNNPKLRELCKRFANTFLKDSVKEDLEDFEGMKFKFSKDSDGVAVKALAGDGGRELGNAELFFNDEGQLDPQTLWVDERYYGQGIAKAMYDFLKNKGYTVIRSWDQTDAGKGFWDKHRGPEVNVWETAGPKTLDPEIYGEFLPFPTMKKIVQSVVKSVDPTAKLKIKDDWGTCMIEGEKIRFDFSITADGGEINAYIVNAYVYQDYRGHGIIQEILRQCFKAMADLYGQPEKFNLTAQEDRGHGVWQAIAQKLGANWGGSNI